MTAAEAAPSPIGRTFPINQATSLVLGRTSSRRRRSREILSSGSILVTPQELPVTESSGEKLSALHNHAVSRPLGRLIAHCLNVIAVRIQHKRGIVLAVIGSIARATVRVAASLSRHLVE